MTLLNNGGYRRYHIEGYEYRVGRDGRHVALFRWRCTETAEYLELVVAAEEGNEKIEITDEKVVERLQENPAAYDKGGEMHYDIISAFIKSIRGSDPDAAVYWLARMVAGGEDPEFIARRLVISASEDIGLANPNALLLANACFDALKENRLA